MKYRWTVSPVDVGLAATLAHSLGIPPLLARCLINRGFREAGAADEFLNPRLRQLSDPLLLPGMTTAVERLYVARERGEPLVIFGDYDVDGVTSAALLLEVLEGLGWRAHCYLPHRMDEGYGLTTEAVENCLKQFPVSLLLAVDCGSSNAAVIEVLKDRGVDVIVLDHHQVSDPAPPALALVNPRVVTGSESSGGKATEFCSAGLAFKLAHALVKRGRQLGLEAAANYDIRPLLDLTALGTIADVVPLTGENRILVSAGLERLNQTHRPGLIALKRVAQCPLEIGVHEVGFQLAPRLNAAGRLKTAEQALQLLMSRDMAAAFALATNLDAHNRERQRIEKDIAAEALAAVESRFKPDSDLVIVEANLKWHIGVVGIVASRVLQRYYRPTIIVGGDAGQCRGSGRSIAGFDLAAALRECSELLLRHGGHAMAAGLSIAPEKIDAFRVRLNEVAGRFLRPAELQAPLQVDAEIALKELTLDSIKCLGRLKPMGQGNRAVQFLTRKLVHQAPLRRMGPEGKHLKMRVSDGTAAHEAVWWGAGRAAVPEGSFDLAYVPQENTYNGRSCVQLKVLDWRPSTSI